jgi:succinate dehydrogenase hydrophobic anchor subunit
MFARLLRILRLMKLIRLFKYNRSISKILSAQKMNQGVKRMISVTITMLFLVHLMGCLFYMIAMLNDFQSNSWVVRLGKMEEGPFRLYLFGINWALQTLTTVGYGDINAYEISERELALVWMIFGVGFYSFTIGNLAGIISAIDVRAAHL